MKPDSTELVDRVRGIFAELVELEKTAPGEADRVVGAMVSHLRSWRPVAITPLGVLPAPTETIRDPRVCTTPASTTQQGCTTQQGSQ